MAIARAIGDRQWEAASLGNLGNAYYSLGEYKRAINYHNQSLAIARAIGDRPQEAKSLSNLGLAYGSSGEYKRAIYYLSQTLAFKRAIGDRQWEAASLGNLGLVYGSSGEYKRAIYYHNQSLAIARAIGDRPQEAKSLGNLGLAYHSLGDYKRAINYHTRSWAIARAIGDRAGEAASLGNLGNASDSLGKYIWAIDDYNKSWAIERAIGDRGGEAKSLGNLGLAYDSLGEYKRAIDYYNQSLAIARAIEDRGGQANSLKNLGYTYLHSGNPKAAEEDLYKALAVHESIRKDLGSNDAFKISIFETQSNSYHLLQQALVVQDRTTEALLISERGRARAFVELLTSEISPNSQSESPPPPKIEEIKQIAKIQNSTLVEYSIIYKRFKAGGKPQDNESNESELYIWVIKPTGEVTFRKTDLKPLLQQQNISLKDKVVQARESIFKGASIASRGNNIPLSPGDRVKLNGDLPTWESWEVLSVNPQKQTITVWLPSGGTGTKSDRPITDVVEKVTNSASANAKSSQLQELYQLLIKPIADLLPKEETARVIFIPQDALFLVPFPALQDSSGQYLIDKHTILTAPSIEVLDSTHKLRQRVPGSAKDILVVGNPIMPKVSSKPGEPPKQLDPLPGAEKEALAVAWFWKTKALIGNQATEDTVLSKLPSARIVHLATHGWFDTIQGLGSWIALAPSANSDGLLKAEDIYNLYAQSQTSPLSAELVVLSACDTGQGRLTGDGVIGLSRSIIAAGVPSVIVSLWSIPDAPTAELMTEFYQNLQRQPDKAQALRQAMLTTKKKHPNPAEWAAFTLIGESE